MDHPENDERRDAEGSRNLSRQEEQQEEEEEEEEGQHTSRASLTGDYVRPTGSLLVEEDDGNMQLDTTPGRLESRQVSDIAREARVTALQNVVSSGGLSLQEIEETKIFQWHFIISSLSYIGYQPFCEKWKKQKQCLVSS